MAFISLLAISLLVGLATKLIYDRWNPKPRLPYPPGPEPKFLTGNIFDFPKKNSARTFAEWGKKHDSGIVSASGFLMHVVVINDSKIAEDLLEKRAKIYNSRPPMPIVKFVEWESNIVLMPQGDEWRKHRKICQQNFHASAAKQYYNIQHGQVEKFLKNVLQEPKGVFEHTTLLSISATMLMMYGYAPETTKDPLIQTAEEAARLAATLFDFNGTLINVFPFLYYLPSWMPGTEGKIKIDKVKQLTRDAKRLPIEHVTAIKSGTLQPSLVTEFFERKATASTFPGEEKIIKDLAWAVYGAASDTTISATKSFLFLMVTHPSVQVKAQEEFDRVVGDTRLPDFNDRPNLPYIEAVYHEVMRHSPPLPLGVGHELSEDDVYEGYFLPKGSAVITNIWAMTHDESVYPDPFLFRPERFLDSNGKMKQDSRILAYGFGRRICAGKYVASNFMWLIIASFLASFKIDPAKDDMGNVLEIDDSYHDVGVVSHKKHFACSITPRSEKMYQVVEASPGSGRYQG